MVCEAPDPITAFSEYANQVLGVPWATTKDLVILRQKVADVFHRYPHADFNTLCRLVMWCKSKHIRKSRVWLLLDEPLRQAWASRQLPELDAPREDPDVDRRIADALKVETDPVWRRRFLLADGVAARRQVLAAWLEAHT